MKKVIVALFASSAILLAGCMHQTTPSTMPEGTGAVATGAATTGEAAMPTVTGAQHKEVNTETSTVKWLAKKVGGQHSGTVKVKSGSVDFMDGKLAGGSFVIDMTTITLDDKMDAVKKHLESDDFFAVAKNPEASLKITKVKAAATANAYDVTADLTIKGITKPVNFVATVDPATGSAKAPIVIDRTLWDIKFRSLKFFSDIADKAIDDDVSFEVMINVK